MQSPRRPLVLLILAAFATAGCPGGDESRLTASPGIVEFGVLLQGDVAERTVTLHNGGTRDVTITGASTNCSCFLLRPFGRLLHPGEERALTVTFDSGKIGGGATHGKVLDILSDDPAAPRIQVSLTGEVVQALNVYPTALHLGILGEPTSLQEKTVQVRPGPSMTLELVRWQVQPRERFEVEKKEVDGGFDFVVQWKAPENVGSGLFLGSLEIRVRAGNVRFPARELSQIVRIQGNWPPR